MGGKPSKGTPADKRLRQNHPARPMPPTTTPHPMPPMPKTPKMPKGMK